MTTIGLFEQAQSPHYSFFAHHLHDRIEIWRLRCAAELNSQKHC